jgi:pantoate--beta-alanine ligase
MQLITTTAELHQILDDSRKPGRSLGLVPTMGALHDGHRALMASARALNDLCAISIFVNPTQFNETADFEQYPRDLDRDVEIAKSSGIDLVFAPSVEELYPGGDPVVHVDPGTMGDGLEGSSRPGHFVGVATVVTKLFGLFAPDRAYFGEKDFEQLALIRRLVLDLSFPIQVVACPTVRDADGLALSSRNARLDPAQRAAAPTIYAALQSGAEVLATGGGVAASIAAMREVVALGPLIEPDYLEIRDSVTLTEPGPDARELRLLIAAHLGSVRLIDNLGVSL